MTKYERTRVENLKKANALIMALGDETAYFNTEWCDYFTDDMDDDDYLELLTDYDYLMRDLFVDVFMKYCDGSLLMNDANGKLALVTIPMK